MRLATRHATHAAARTDMDHIGTVDLFPNATFSMARCEFEFWTGPHAERPCLALALGEAELGAIKKPERQGRLFLVGEATHEVYQGIRLITSPGPEPAERPQLPSGQHRDASTCAVEGSSPLVMGGFPTDTRH
ncbi:hypothetical protein [Streptomyces sp. NPDC017964]|uniref:hypothetical protein n=1 Tax=Streptomyces sp. NPDC017964 TaxID=3365022 RepID=UPI0037BC8CDA